MTGLSHKTTILLSEALHRRLTQLARERGQSLGELVRQACERQYGVTDRRARLAAVEELGTMRLPVGPVEKMIGRAWQISGIQIALRGCGGWSHPRHDTERSC